MDATNFSYIHTYICISSPTAVPPYVLLQGIVLESSTCAEVKGEDVTEFG